MNRLQKYLIENGVTPAFVAGITGFAPSTVTRHVRGERKVSPESALVYERELGIPAAELRPDIFSTTRAAQ